MGGVAFFVSLDHHRQAKRQFAVNCQPVPCGFREGHQLALVVGGSPGKDARLAGCCFAPARLKWWAVPQGEGINRLHIVMAIKQDMGNLALRFSRGHVIRNHHRLARGGIGARGKAHAFEIIHHPVGGLSAIGVIGRVRGDGGIAQQFAQIVDAVLDIRINGGQYGRYVVSHACESLYLQQSLTQVVMIGQSA